MAGKSHISEETRQSIKDLIQKGYTQKAIAQRKGLSQAMICIIGKELKDE